MIKFQKQLIISKTKKLSLFDYNHSISNNMISINPIGELTTWHNFPEPTRRKRTPSQYAESIRQLTKISTKNSKKYKSPLPPQDQLPPSSPADDQQDNPLNCILPHKNKLLKISVIIKKPSKTKTNKICTMPNLEKEKRKEKQVMKNSSFLDTLLQILKQYDVDGQHKKDREQPKSNQGPTLQYQMSRKQNRNRKDKEFQDKYVKFYEKFRNLNEKYETMENDVIII